MIKVRIPKVIQNGRLIVRGTPAWDAREAARQDAGCELLGFGSIQASLDTNGRTAKLRSGRL